MYCQTKSILIFQIIGFLVLSVLAGLFAVFPMVFGIMGATMMTDQKLMVTRQPSINITKQYRTRLPFLFFLPRRGGGEEGGGREEYVHFGPDQCSSLDHGLSTCHPLPLPQTTDCWPPPIPGHGLFDPPHHLVLRTTSVKKKDFQLPSKIMFSMASVITTRRIITISDAYLPVGSSYSGDHRCDLVNRGVITGALLPKFCCTY